MDMFKQVFTIYLFKSDLRQSQFIRKPFSILAHESEMSYGPRITVNRFKMPKTQRPAGALRCWTSLYLTRIGSRRFVPLDRRDCVQFKGTVRYD
jgi:hypothetical protein